MTQDLRETGYDWAVASGVVVEFKERGSHQLVVTRDREQGLLWQGDQEQALVLLRVSAVGRHVRVLGGLEIRPPPVGNHLLCVCVCV